MTDYASAMKTFWGDINDTYYDSTRDKPKIKTNGQYKNIYTFGDKVYADLILLHGNGFYHENAKRRIMDGSHSLDQDLADMWDSADKPSPCIEIGKIYAPGRGFLYRDKQKAGSNTNSKDRHGEGTAKTTDHVSILFTPKGELYLFVSYWLQLWQWELNEKNKDVAVSHTHRYQAVAKIKDEKGEYFSGADTVLLLDQFGYLNQINKNGEVIHKIYVGTKSVGTTYSQLRLYAGFKAVVSNVDKDPYYPYVYYNDTDNDREYQAYKLVLESYDGSKTRTLSTAYINGTKYIYFESGDVKMEGDNTLTTETLGD